MPAFGKYCSLRSMKYQNSRAGSLSPSSMSGPAAAKSVVGWRSRRRAAPRSQLVGHGAGAPCGGQRQRSFTRQPRRFKDSVFCVQHTERPVRVHGKRVVHLVGKHAWQHMSAPESQRGHPDAALCTPKKWLALCCPCKSNGSWLPNSLLSPPPVMANHSLNLTLCGGPILGSKV